VNVFTEWQWRWMAYKDGNSSWEDYRDWYDAQHAQNYARLGRDPLPHTWRHGAMFPDWEFDDDGEEAVA
jgi:hypothetical protein